MTVESIKGRAAEFSKIENKWVDAPVLQGSLDQVKQILNHPELFIFTDWSVSPLPEVTFGRLYPLSEVRMIYAVPKDEETGFTSRLRVIFKLCEVARAPQAKDFKASIVLELGVQGYISKFNRATGISERAPSGQAYVDIPLPLNLDTSDIVVDYWSRLTKPQFGKNSEAVKRQVEMIKLMQADVPEKIKCTTWSGLKGEITKAG